MRYFDFQAISNRPKFLERLVATWIAQEMGTIAQLSICAQGESVKWLKGQILPKSIRWLERPEESPPRLMSLRKSLQEELPPCAPYIVVIDDDHHFTDKSLAFFGMTFCELENIARATGRWPYMGLSGGLGSNHSLGRIVIPPQPLMATYLGLILHSELIKPWKGWDMLDTLIAGGEDKLICAMAIGTGNSVPLKRFLSDIRRYERPSNERPPSHNIELMRVNCLRMVRVIGDDRDWVPQATWGDDRGKVDAPENFIKWVKLWKKYTRNGQLFNWHTSEAIRRKTNL